jgi:hypothetical protein
VLQQLDRHSRPIIVMDPSRENSKNHDSQLRHLVWQLERAKRKMNVRPHAEGPAADEAQAKPAFVEKYCLFINMERNSIWNSPPLKTSMETLKTLTDRLPEHLGQKKKNLTAVRPAHARRTEDIGSQWQRLSQPCRTVGLQLLRCESPLRRRASVTFRLRLQQLCLVTASASQVARAPHWPVFSFVLCCFVLFCLSELFVLPSGPFPFPSLSLPFPFPSFPRLRAFEVTRSCTSPVFFSPACGTCASL